MNTVEPAAANCPEPAAVPGEIEARARLTACMQDLIRDLGDANARLARELERRRTLAREMARLVPDPSAGREFESMMVACGAMGLLSVPPVRNGSVHEPHTVAAPLARRFADPARLFVNHLRPVPRWEPLARVLRRVGRAEGSQLMNLAGDLVALRLAQACQPPLTGHAVDELCGSAAVMITDHAGIIRLANQRLLALTGHERDALLGRHWLPALVPEEDWPAMRRLPGFPGPAGLLGRDVWIKGERGKTFPLRWHARPVLHLRRAIGAVTVMMEEGTEQDERMEDLANRERLYRRVFEEDLTGHYSCTPDGRLTECNATFARIFGFGSVAEARACNLRQLHLSGEAADRFLDELQRRRRLIYHESTMRRVDGRKIHVVRNVTGDFDEAGRLQLVTGFIFDNTEHKQLEERVRHTQKMDTVGRLAGGIAHDFNNLLLAIQGYASLLAEHVVENAEASDALGQIQRAADRAAALTRQLLAFSRRQVLQPRELNLNEVVTAMVPLLQRLLGESNVLETRLAPDLALVRADRAQLEEVLVHLVSNARDALPTGGHVALVSRNVELHDTWFSFHDGPPPGGYVELSVQDNGTGMSEEVKAHLFEPFFTTKGQGKGTGLGLPTVYGIIKQSGGEVQAYSTAGQGTTIKILLPRLVREDSAAAAGTVPGTAARRHTVLVVEDEPAVRQLVKRVLDRAGFEVVDATTGSEALARVEQEQLKVDLLVTDLVLPGMSGRELFEHLQARQPDLEVIYMSGHTEDAVIKHGVLQSKVSFLQKPFRPEALIEKARSVLAKD